MMRNERVEGGIFMASNVADTTAVWNCTINDEEGEFIGAHGDIEHFRELLGICCSFMLICCESINLIALFCSRTGPHTRTLEAGELIWMTDRTPHESLPIPASAGTAQRRQYFRLVVGQVTAWFADHSTPNPLGTVPPPEVRIVRGDKFSLYPTLNRSWHCGTPEKIRAACAFQKVQQKLYEFGLGHMSQRVFDYGLTSPKEIIRVNNSQREKYWSREHSANGNVDLFSDRGCHYYDRIQFEALVKSLQTKLR